MIGDKGKAIIIENTLNQRSKPHAFFHLNFEPLKEGDNPIKNPEIITTRGYFYIKYSPLNRFGSANKYPYIVFCDLFPKRAFSFASEEGLRRYEVKITGVNEVNETIKNYIDFLINKTTFSPELIRIARENEYIEIPFIIDYLKVEKIIKEKMGIEGQAYSVLNTPDNFDKENNARRLFKECY